MENLNHQKATRAACRIRALAILVLTAVVCVSCGPNVIKGRPPFISISGMYLIDNNLSADYDISNQNGVEMTIEMIDITVVINEVEISRLNKDFDLVIGANSTEEVHVDKLPDEFTRVLLTSLDSGEVKSLSFDLKGKVLTVEDGNLRFEHKGYLYPVPGKPGYFRSAVTQARELRREENF
jgi:hypothetical protein